MTNAMSPDVIAPPTRAELYQLIQRDWRPSIEGDLDRIAAWVDARSESWPPSLKSKVRQILRQISFARRMDDLPDAVLADAHLRLWSLVRSVNIELSRSASQRAGGREGARRRWGSEVGQRRRMYFEEVLKRVDQGMLVKTAMAIAAKKFHVSESSVRNGYYAERKRLQVAPS